MRAAGLSVLVVALAGVAHGLGGGAAPGPGLVAALVAVSLPVTVLVAGRRINRPAAVAVLSAGQLALHHVFAVLGSCGPVAADPGVHAHHATHLTVRACESTAGTGAPVDGRVMVAWHVLSTVLTALAVAGAERAVVHAAAVLAPLLRAPAELVAPVLVRVLPRGDSSAGAATLHLRGTPGRRGPPGASFLPAAPR